MGRRQSGAASQERESRSKLSRSGLETTWRSLYARCVPHSLVLLCTDLHGATHSCVLSLARVQILHKLFLDGDEFEASDLQEMSYNSPTCQPSVGNLDMAVTQRLLEQSTAQSIAFDGLSLIHI